MHILKKITYLLRCESCKMILSVALEDKEDRKDMVECKTFLECPCGEKCTLLTN